MGKRKRRNIKKIKEASAKQNNYNGYDFVDTPSDKTVGSVQQDCWNQKLDEPKENCDIRVNIVFNNDPLWLECCGDTSVMELKKTIGALTGLKVQELNLKLNGYALVDTQRLIELLPKNRAWTVTKYIYDFFNLTNILLADEITIYLELLPFGGRNKMWWLDQALFDSQNDKDFRGLKAIAHLSIWGLKYSKPFGSYLQALKVRDQYEDNVWLGEEGKEGEWAVAYHGSSYLNIQDIVRCGQLEEQFAVRCAYGPGIYCSPFPATALEYAYKFHYERKLYKAILQVRVNPKKVKIAEKEIWVVPEEYIRITGICLYEI